MHTHLFPRQQTIHGVPVLIHNSEPTSCFGLLGCHENAATAAVAWCFDRAPAFRASLGELLDLPELGVEQVLARCQVFADDKGFTDLELTGGRSIHVIVEAKVGWQVPTQKQFERYLPRLHAANLRHKVLVTVSAAQRSWAASRLPRFDGVRVHHLSWEELGTAAADARSQSSSPIEKLWLGELVSHLKGYGMTSNIFDARAFVVSLSRDRIRPDAPLTFIDVVAKQRRYFHPFGKNWPTIAPAYLGFRYLGAFQSAHFVEG